MCKFIIERSGPSNTYPFEYCAKAVGAKKAPMHVELHNRRFVMYWSYLHQSELSTLAN
jgi:hypothetical protein